MMERKWREEKEEKETRIGDGGETFTRMGPLDQGQGRSGYERGSIGDALYCRSGLASIATGRKELDVSNKPIRSVFLLNLLLLLPRH